MLVGVYYSLMSFFGILLTYVIIILIALAVLIILLWFWPWWWGFAIMMTVVYLSIMIPLLVIVVFFKDFFGVQSPLAVPSSPSKPSCFGPNTRIKLADGGVKFVRHIVVGDTLTDGGVVTATLKLSAIDQPVYDIDGILVTGEHFVRDDTDGTWGKVKHRANVTLRPDYADPFVYCLNTTTKHISCINSTYGTTTFADWDELYAPGMVEAHIRAYEGIITRLSDAERKDGASVHKYLDGGMVANTQVAYPEGVPDKPISCVKVGDLLLHGTRVTGIVRISGRDMQPQCEYYTNKGKRLIGGPHNVFKCNDPAETVSSTLFLLAHEPYDQKPDPLLYHLVTDTEMFHLCNGMVMRDYNACTDFTSIVKADQEKK